MVSLSAVDTLGARDTPLCPAGHLPHRWGDRLGASARSTFIVWRRPNHWPISPLVGEMSGRTEGGDLGAVAISETPEPRQEPDKR